MSRSISQYGSPALQALIVARALEKDGSSDYHAGHMEGQLQMQARIDALEAENKKLRLDAARFDWSLDLLLGDDASEADQKALELSRQLMRGLDGRAAIDAAMEVTND